jgi:hypothetical protein
MAKTSKRAVMKTDGVTPLTNQQIRTVLKETFSDRELPNCDLVLLGQDLARAFEPLMRIPEDRRLSPFVRNTQKHLRNALLKIENTPKNELILNAVGRNHAGRIKDRGIEARDMSSYDKLVQSTGYAHYEDFVEAEIREFFRLRDQFLGWLSDDEILKRMIGFLQPATLDTLITVDLPAIFQKHFPGQGVGNSPTSKCTELIGHILREAGIYPGPDPNAMIVKRRQR